MSVWVSAGDCARQLYQALEAMGANQGINSQGPTHHGLVQGQRVGVPVRVPLDIYREENGNTWVVLEVPGAKRDSIMVNLNQDQNLLTISGFLEKPRPFQQQGERKDGGLRSGARFVLFLLLLAFLAQVGLAAPALINTREYPDKTMDILEAAPNLDWDKAGSILAGTAYWRHWSAFDEGWRARDDRTMVLSLCDDCGDDDDSDWDADEEDDDDAAMAVESDDKEPSINEKWASSNKTGYIGPFAGLIGSLTRSAGLVGQKIGLIDFWHSCVKDPSRHGCTHSFNDRSTRADMLNLRRLYIVFGRLLSAMPDAPNRLLLCGRVVSKVFGKRKGWLVKAQTHWGFTISAVPHPSVLAKGALRKVDKKLLFSASVCVYGFFKAAASLLAHPVLTAQNLYSSYYNNPRLCQHQSVYSLSGLTRRVIKPERMIGHEKGWARALGKFLGRVRHGRRHMQRAHPHPHPNSTTTTTFGEVVRGNERNIYLMQRATYTKAGSKFVRAGGQEVPMVRVTRSCGCPSVLKLRWEVNGRLLLPNSSEGCGCGQLRKGGKVSLRHVSAAFCWRVITAQQLDDLKIPETKGNKGVAVKVEA